MQSENPIESITKNTMSDNKYTSDWASIVKTILAFVLALLGTIDANLDHWSTYILVFIVSFIVLRWLFNTGLLRWALLLGLGFLTYSLCTYFLSEIVSLVVTIIAITILNSWLKETALFGDACPTCGKGGGYTFGTVSTQFIRQELRLQDVYDPTLQRSVQKNVPYNVHDVVSWHKCTKCSAAWETRGVTDSKA